MSLFCPPGVYRPQADTRLLQRAAREAALPHRPRVLDPCTGSGALAIGAARSGASTVTAVDVSWRSIAAAWLNSRKLGVSLELVRGDFADVLGGREFDVVLANPPYIPCPDSDATSGVARAWNGGTDGRTVVDTLCTLLPGLLTRDGVALIVHSALCGTHETVRALRAHGLKASVVARQTIPFGPVLRQRSAWLEERGLIGRGERFEELVVIRAESIER
ncbi:HemK2/MTQ2 family protein methyltransferase [Nocardia callitridis]|uniref:Methyltransferase n=1 Tax=Nocardia callitridis TaxID=648753 RepID=A0ABP9KUP7_9NOCA